MIMKIKLVKKIFDWLSIKENLIKIILWLIIFLLLKLVTNNFNLPVYVRGYLNLQHHDVDIGVSGSIDLDGKIRHGDIDVNLGNQPKILGTPSLNIDISK
jgi:hypothetical protein